MKVAVVIVNFNGNKDTLECLESLLKIDRDSLTLMTIVVDNASEIPFSASTEKFSEIGLSIIENSENLGFTGGSNTGIRIALEKGADYVLLLNSDTYVDKKFLKGLLDFSKDKGNCLISPKIYFAKGYEFHKEKYKKEELGKVIWYAGGNMDMDNVIGSHIGVDEVDRGQFDKASEVDFITGCCVLVPKEVFGKIGLLDENYFLYYEDADFSFRAKRAGISSYYYPNSIIWHKNAGSTGGSGSKVQDYYISRNRIYFGMKYAPARAKIALVTEGLRNLLFGRKFQRRGTIDYFLGRLGREGNY